MGLWRYELRLFVVSEAFAVTPAHGKGQTTVSFVMTVLVALPMTPDAALDAALTTEGPRTYRLRMLDMVDATSYSSLLDVYGGTYNHVPDDEFMEWLSGLPWRWADGGWLYPREQVVVVTHHEYSEAAPRVHRLTKDGWETL